MDRKRILYICGSLNQTSQMHAIAKELPEHDASFTPFYTTGPLEFARRMRALDNTIAGFPMVARCEDYLRDNRLRIDYRGLSHDYDLVLTCSDQVIQSNIRNSPIVLVQEGMTDPVNPLLKLSMRFPNFPHWMAGTAATGQSRIYRRFCVGSHGYLEHFESLGIDSAKIRVTGIPNFDNCERYYNNDFPHRGYVLVCTSDLRETYKIDNRPKFINQALDIARGRQLIFKLHPNENESRARREIAKYAPGALAFRSGSAEEMVANADAVVCQLSSLIFVALALGKESYSYFEIEELLRLLPLQNGCAARNIADVCRGVLQDAQPAAEPESADVLVGAVGRSQ